jgi:hypothetical protein
MPGAIRIWKGVQKTSYDNEFSLVKKILNPHSVKAASMGKRLTVLKCDFISNVQNIKKLFGCNLSFQKIWVCGGH